MAKNATASAESSQELRAWRVQVLNNLLATTTIVAVPVLVLVIVEAIRKPEQWLAALAFSAIFLVVLALAAFRRLAFSLRAWGFLLLGYLAGALAFARGGLAGDGRLYLLALPVLALIMIGLHAGLITAILSLVIYSVFAATAHLGWMAHWLVSADNTLRLIDWLYGGAAFAMLLLILVIMQWRFGWFLTDLVAERGLFLRNERRQRELAEALAEAAAVVSSTLDLDEVLDRILEQVERVVRGDAFDIMLIEDGHARVVRRRDREGLTGTSGQVGSTYLIRQFPSLLKMMQTGESIVIPDTAADPDWVPLPEQKHLHSYVASPIKVTGLIVGFLNVSATHPGQFNTGDAQRLEAFTYHTATAIQNAQLYRELHSHAEQLEERVQERTAQLQAQYARLDAILQSTADGIVVTDEEGEIVQTNPVARDWLTARAPQDTKLLKEAVRGLSLHPSKQPEEILELDGLDLQLRARPISVIGIENATAVVNLQDVSHLKELDRLKSRFVSNVSVELKTPLTAIRLYAQMLRERPEQWEEDLDRLEEATDRQTQLVESLLQISRIETERLQWKLRPTSLNELTGLVIESYQPMAAQRGLVIEHRPLEPAPVALADPEWMVQALVNLVTNAIQYTPEGQIVVLTGKEENEGRTWATTTVMDTGIGIPEKELSHLFERFFRGEQAQAMQISGTGLGLAIVKEIMNQHGGQVTVESQAGQGTAFTLWLPTAKAPVTI